MYISHSVMEGQRHNNPLKPRFFGLQRPKRMGLHAIVEAAKGLGGSLVTLTPKTAREMTQLPRETQFKEDTGELSLSAREINHNFPATDRRPDRHLNPGHITAQASTVSSRLQEWTLHDSVAPFLS